MTDTIGWGDIDVEPPRRRRRLPRAARLLVWPVAAVIVAVAVLTPRIESHLGDGAAAWLARQWKLAAAYDAARVAVLSHASERASSVDGALFTAVVTDVDRDEASRLARIATNIGHRHGWSADVRRALRAAQVALRAQARDLLAHAARPQPYFSGSYYVDQSLSSRSQSLVADADRLIASVSHRHHVRVAQPPSVRLTGASTPLAQLDRLTARPLPLRLAIAQNGDLDVWNLQDGSVRRNVADIALDSGFSVRRVGTSLLALTPDGQWVLVPAGGGRTHVLPRAADYLPAGDNGLWQADGRVVRRLDANGRQLGRTYSMPAGFGAPFGSTSDALVIALDQPYAGTYPYVWIPAIGSVRPVPGACNGGAVAAGRRVVFVPCDDVQHLVVMDTRTGKVRPLQTPSGLQVIDGSQLLSPDGRRVVAQVAPSGGYDESSSSPQLAVWDLDNGRAQLIPQPAVALAWSPDGSVLVVNTNSGGSSTNIPLAYWMAGTQTLAPIRIPLGDTSGITALLPPG